MVSPVSSRRLGTLFEIYRVRLEMTIISTYAMASNIQFFGKSLCPEATFLIRKSRDPERRCHINVVIIRDLGMRRSD
jgi:hypothetical protein